MSEFDKFKNAMGMLKSVHTEGGNGYVPNHQIGNFLNIQVTSLPEQNLIAIHVCLRKDGGYYFPLGDLCAKTVEDIIVLLDQLLTQYGIDMDKILLQQK